MFVKKNMFTHGEESISMNDDIKKLMIRLLLTVRNAI